MCTKDADGMSNRVDPDQTGSSGAVWSGSTLFAQTYLSENLGSLWHIYSNSIHPNFYFSKNSDRFATGLYEGITVLAHCFWALSMA